MSLQMMSVQAWCAHPTAAPRTERRDGALLIAANGTRTCAGGWQIEYGGAEPGATYEIACEVEHVGVPEPADTLHAALFWGSVAADRARRDPLCRWDYLPLHAEGDGRARACRRLTAPADASTLTVRYTFRWSAAGTSCWTLPRVAVADGAEPGPMAVRVSVVTGTEREALRPRASVAEDVAQILGRCEAACRAGAALVVLPEAALQYGLRDHPSPLDLAVALDSPEVASVRDVARRHRARIVLGLWERDGDAVFNSAALIGPDGRVDGVYRKTHLAVGGENEGGVLPGTSYPVVPTEVGRIGCTICVDSSTLEASRMVGAGGADIIAIPIAGDNRADRSTGIGPSVFDEDRWRAIMRTRAMDNHVVLAVARNNAKGSCVISARGDVLAFNDGDAERVDATVIVRADDRAWNGGSLRDIQWMQRRPHLYGRLTDRGPSGPLRRGGERGGID